MQNQLEDRAYAGFFVRAVAFSLDFVIAAIVGGMLKAPFATAAAFGLDVLKENFLFQYSFVDVMGYLGQAAYFVLMTWFNHATLGKMLMRLEVVTDGGDWTFINVLYRETVGRFLSSLFLVGYLVVLGQSRKQGFHDMLCDTFVVYKNMALRDKAPAIKPAIAGTQDAQSAVYAQAAEPSAEGIQDAQSAAYAQDAEPSAEGTQDTQSAVYAQAAESSAEMWNRETSEEFMDEQSGKPADAKGGQAE